MNTEEPIVAELPFQDRVEFHRGQPKPLKAQGCLEFLESVKEWVSQHGTDPTQWPSSLTKTHGHLLLQELARKARGEWQNPVPAEELCHCRAVPTKTVDQAIINGAHTLEKIRRWTGANTACGTCLNECQALLDYRLK